MKSARNDVRVMIRPGSDTNRMLLDVFEEAHARGVLVSLHFTLPISGVELALRLREIRIAAGLKQRELADLCGTTEKSISSVEANTQGRADHLSFSLLFRIAEACGVDLARLIAPQWRRRVETPSVRVDETRKRAGGGDGMEHRV